MSGIRTSPASARTPMPARHMCRPSGAGPAHTVREAVHCARGGLAREARDADQPQAHFRAALPQPGLEPIPVLDEARQILPEPPHPLGVCVCLHAVTVKHPLHLPRTLDCVHWEHERRDLVVDIALVGELQEREDLPWPGYRPLQHGVGVADVGLNDHLEGYSIPEVDRCSREHHHYALPLSKTFPALLEGRKSCLLSN